MAVSDLPEALDALASGDFERVEHTTLAVSDGERTHERVTEAMVMTTAPATISEFGVRYGGEQICEYRADGIVVATPPTGGGYARAAGGPRVDTTVSAAVVVPVAPYRTTPDEWVLRDTVTVEVVRDEGTVGLFVDGEQIGGVACGESVEFTPAGAYRSLRVDAGRSPLASRP